MFAVVGCGHRPASRCARRPAAQGTTGESVHVNSLRQSCAKESSHRVAEIYERSMADFGQAAFMMLSRAPELHAAAWSFLRKSELVGEAPRTDKEVVTVAVSRGEASADLVRLLGFGAMTAVDRVEDAIAGPARTAAP